MKRIFLVTLALPLVFLIGCADQIGVKQVTVDPDKAMGGDEFMISVHFAGPKGKLASVTATVRENPDVFFVLNDEGKSGDTAAGDNIWSMVTSVPMDAPAGIYNLDISARDQEGNEIVTEGLEGQNLGRSGSVKVTVQ